MLTRSFLHLPHVGLQRERRLWDDGILSWDELLARRDLFDDGPPASLEEGVVQSRLKLSLGDARWFEERLGAGNAWRLAADFDDGRIAYLDIETDNAAGDFIAPGADRPGGATVAAVWDGATARVFRRDRDLDELPTYLEGYPVLCTFNGKAFDVPYLEHRFGRGFYRGAHLDLRPLTRAVGWTGGLKKIEVEVGLQRHKQVRHYTGYDAVKLWHCYRHGRKDALEPLARYNLADAVGLQPLLRATYNRAVAMQNLPFRRFDLLVEEGAERAVEAGINKLMRG